MQVLKTLQEKLSEHSPKNNCGGASFKKRAALVKKTIIGFS